MLIKLKDTLNLLLPIFILILLKYCQNIIKINIDNIKRIIIT